jgi:hypothetical protein
MIELSQKYFASMSILNYPVRRIHRAGFRSQQIQGEITMRFLCLYKAAKPEGTPPTQEEMTRMGKLIEESFKSGTLLATEGCLPTALGARIRRTDGKFKVTDGPFAEAKEIVGGFALIQTKSKQEAIEFTKDFMNVAGDGEVEIRQVYEEPAK